MAGFSVVSSRTVVYGAALNSMIASPDGPVGTIMRQKAEQAFAYAHAHCPVESAESAARHHRDSGRLVASIFVRRTIQEGGPGVAYEVGSPLIYARRIEFNHKVGGWLRGALTVVGGEIVGNVG